MKRLHLILIVLLTFIGAACVDIGDAPKDGGWDLDERQKKDDTDDDDTDPDVDPDVDPDKDPDIEHCGDCCAPDDCTVIPDPGPDLVGMFVSGHLGNYLDCPDEGYSATASAEPGAGFAGDCAPSEDGDSDGCGVLNCEGAQLTMRLDNIGDLMGRDIDVVRLELFNSAGDLVADLPVLEVLNADTGEEFDHSLDADQSALLRVDYAGPADPYEMLKPSPDGDRRGGYSGTIRITIESSNHPDVIITSTELYVLPSIAT